MEHRAVAYPSSLAVGPMLLCCALGRNSDSLYAWKPYVLCSHIAFLCFRLELKNRDCDGVMLVVDTVMHWEILLVALTGERVTVAIECSIWGSRCQPSYKHNKKMLYTTPGDPGTAV